jgi:hypothetical protein
VSTDQTTKLGLPFVMPAQAQKHVTVNEGLLRLDALVQLAVESRSVTSQPGSPTDGGVWIAPAGKTGPEWGGYTDWSLAYYRDGSWEPIAPLEGWRAWVKDEDVVVSWTGSAWSAALPVTTIELGHASDTTLSRYGSGLIAVEGGVLPKENRSNTFNMPQAIRVSGSTSAHSFGDDLVVGNEVSNAGISILAKNDSSSSIFFGDAESATQARVLYNHSSDTLVFGAGGSSSLVTVASGGSVWGSATGGAKGAGTINAQAVYDDNALLSCYVFDATLDGAVDVAKWDSRVPDRVTPEEWDEVQTGVREVEVGRETVDGVERPIYAEEPVYERVKIADEIVTPRVHDGARRFSVRLGTAHDPLTLDGYAAHWRDKRHLTSMPNEEAFDPLVGLSSGEWVQRLVETVEIQAVLIEQLNQRVKLLEAAPARGSTP